MATAHEIRQFVIKTYIQPARSRSEKIVSFSAEDIHNTMGLQKRFPLVCSSIDTDKFLDFASVTLIKREGPKQSNTVRWTFSLQ